MLYFSSFIWSSRSGSHSCFVNEHYEWIREFLLLIGGIPCAKTYERVFSIINSSELEEILNDFIMSFNIKSDSEKT